MAKYRWINKGHQNSAIKIEEAERHYKGIYIADLCIATKNGWTQEPISVFWTEKKHPKTKSHYFGLFIQDSQLKVANAASVAEGYWTGIESTEGEIVFSRAHYDFIRSRDGKVFADGGREYGRFGFDGETPKYVMLKIVGSDFVVVDDVEMEYIDRDIKAEIKTVLG